MARVRDTTITAYPRIAGPVADGHSASLLARSARPLVLRPLVRAVVGRRPTRFPWTTASGRRRQTADKGGLGSVSDIHTG